MDDIGYDQNTGSTSGVTIISPRPIPIDPSGLQIGDVYETPENKIHNDRQDYIAKRPNTAVPTVVELPNEHFDGGADAIINAYGTDLDDVKNPYEKPYITGYKENIYTVNGLEGGAFSCPVSPRYGCLVS